jgi:hypothetical protein
MNVGQLDRECYRSCCHRWSDGGSEFRLAFHQLPLELNYNDRNIGARRRGWLRNPPR